MKIHFPVHGVTTTDYLIVVYDMTVTQTCIPEMTTKFHNNNVYVRCSSNECVRVGKEKGDGESIFKSGETDAIPIDLLLNHSQLFPKFVNVF